MHAAAGKMWAVAFLALSLAASAQTGTTSTSEQSEAAAIAPVPAAASSNPASASTPGHGYVIGDDDLLAINVWNEKDLTQSIPVRSDGKISMPLIGEVQAAGRTPVQLEDNIAERLKAYLTNPRVTVIVQKMNSRTFNILGRVMKPGSYPLTATTTVLDAIAVAGGFQSFAKEKDIYIVRPTHGGGQKRIKFNYKNVIRGVDPEQNIRLEPHDTVIVP